MTGNLFDGGVELTLRPLRPRQETGMAMLRQAMIEGHKRIVFQGPPSFGKTLCAAHMIASAMDRGKRPLFVVPAIVLIDQTIAAFEREGIRDIGVIQGNHRRTNPYARVQVASVQTLSRRTPPAVDFMIWDECHLIFQKMLELLASEEWKDKYVIGLSGTPWARGMAKHWTKLVIPATTRELMDEGWMAPYTVYAPAIEYEPDMSGVKTVAGEFDEGQTARVMSDLRIVANVVDTWLRLGEGLPTFLYGVNRAHAQLLRDEFLAVGVPTGYIDGESTAEERAEVFRDFRAGRIRIICSVGTLIIGVDEQVWCIIDAAPTKSRMRQAQKIPRMLRLSPDGREKRAILLDHAGNSTRRGMGLVEDMIQEHLDDGSKEAKEKRDREQADAPVPRRCGECNALIPPRMRKCLSCGYERPLVNTVEHVPGELIALGSSAKGKKGADKVPPELKQQFYAELLGYCQLHGKKPGLAYHKFHTKFGHYPNKKPYPVGPSLETERWMKSQTIKFAKSKKYANLSENGSDNKNVFASP